MHKPLDTKQRLLDTATVLIGQSSYSNVGVNEICEKAGVTKGCFYHHFESKAALFDAAAEYAWEKMKGDLDAIFSPEHDALTRLEQWIDYIIDKQVKSVKEGHSVSGCPFFMSSAQCGSADEAVHRVGLKMAEKSIVYNTALVKSLRDEGCLEGKIDPPQLGRILSHYVEGVLLFGRVMKDLGIVMEDLRDGIYRLIGLKADMRRPAAQPPPPPARARRAAAPKG